MKVYEHRSLQASREGAVNEHLNAMTTSHIGSTLIRTELDTFEIIRPEACYRCFVYRPLGMSLATLRSHCPSRKFPIQLLKPTLIHILLALDFLHTEAKVIHTGNLHHHLSFMESSFLSPFPHISLGFTLSGWPFLFEVLTVY